MTESPRESQHPAPTPVVCTPASPRLPPPLPHQLFPRDCALVSQRALGDVKSRGHSVSRLWGQPEESCAVSSLAVRPPARAVWSSRWSGLGFPPHSACPGALWGRESHGPFSVFGIWLILGWRICSSGLCNTPSTRGSRGGEGAQRREPGALGSSPQSVADLLVTLGKSLSLSGPQFPHLKQGIKVLFGTKILICSWSHLKSSWHYFKQVVLRLSVLQPF